MKFKQKFEFTFLCFREKLLFLKLDIFLATFFVYFTIGPFKIPGVAVSSLNLLEDKTC
jgi:hypothetical protein